MDSDTPTPSPNLNSNLAHDHVKNVSPMMRFFS
jgi:hypothetical protein